MNLYIKSEFRYTKDLGFLIFDGFAFCNYEGTELLRTDIRIGIKNPK